MRKFLTLLTLVLGLGLAAQAQNITPQPRQMTTSSGTYTLPTAFKVSVAGLADSLVAEATRFVEEVNQAGVGASTTTDADEAQVKLSVYSGSMGSEGYRLSITTDGVSIQSQTTAGFFYAFRSLKRLLPDEVRAGKATTAESFSLPLLTINDNPRFAYRGFMLDVSRHFFSVDEVKRMIDLMAEYKMNKFHWHLTDDQGWRIEIKKYPKLTTVGATAPNSRFTSLEEAKAYWINKEYGPYFYTQEELADVVAYAAARHVDVIPEIDMPGHFAAAMAAYPEFSCSPDGSHSVWDNGGISTDVLNVANPKAMQFIKDVLDELVEIFPSHYIHIGGDECPTSAWESNAECQAFYAAQGYTSYRQLQSWFIGQISDYLGAKGRQLSLWNEAITADGADTELVKSTGAPIYCWYPADNSVTKASGLGLPSIYTPWGPYYINRKQGSTAADPPGAGDGTDNVQATYNRSIPSGTSYGVQGTFWCEWVSDSTYMEWLALPRLMAVAEAGWTPQTNRSFDNFIARVAADTTVLKLKNYKYCNYLMPGASSSTDDNKVMPHANTDSKKYYYRLISGGTDATRADRCIELLHSGSSLLTTYSSYGAAENRLWTSPQASEGDDNYEYQWWSIEEDPENAGHYALVCKALPNGSVNPSPTVTSNSGRWTYDTDTKNYTFRLGTAAYGTKNSNYYYSIASDKVSGWYMNSSMSGQGLAVNLWTSATDGGGGQWEFAPLEDYDEGGSSTVVEVPFDTLIVGKLYTLTNAVEGFEGITIADDNSGTTLKHSADPFASNAWEVTAATTNDDGTQTVKLKNTATGRSIGTIGTFASKLGYPVGIGTTASELTLSYVKDYADLRVLTGGKSLFALPSGLVYAGSNVEADSYDAARDQGAEWTVQEVRVVTFACADDQGNDLGTYRRSIPVGTTDITADLCPAFKNNTVQGIEETATDTYAVTYKRSAYAVTVLATDERGAIISEEEDASPVGESYTVAVPTPKYYTFVSSTVADGTSFVPTQDSVITVVYTTDALTGVKKDGEPVTTLQAGKSYLFYDATTASGRSGYRLVRASDNQVNRSTTAEGLLPNAVWTLERSGAGYKVLNEYTGLYVPQLVQSTATTASKTGATFTFALNSDGTTWNIKGSNGQYWDGVENGALVGWPNGNGHPIRISTFYAQPMYSVTINCVDESGAQLQSATELVNAGDPYTLVYPEISGYVRQSVSGAESFAGTVEGYLTVTVTYAQDLTGLSGVTTGQDRRDARVFDLQGRHVSNPGHGIYIVGGKKKLMK